MPTLDHADHPQHDALLIAGHAAGDLPEPHRLRAEALLSACTSCADLRRDLVAITAAARSLPTPPSASRDFRLTAEQAARLQRGSWLRTLLRPFGAPGAALRPMAAALTSLGIAGLFVATMLPALLGGAASAPADREETTSGAGAGAPGATAGAEVAPAAPTDNVYGQANASVHPDGLDDRSTDGASEPPRIAIENGRIHGGTRGRPRHPVADDRPGRESAGRRLAGAARHGPAPLRPSLRGSARPLTPGPSGPSAGVPPVHFELNLRPLVESCPSGATPSHEACSWNA